MPSSGVRLPALATLCFVASLSPWVYSRGRPTRRARLISAGWPFKPSGWQESRWSPGTFSAGAKARVNPGSARLQHAQHVRRLALRSLRPRVHRAD